NDSLWQKEICDGRWENDFLGLNHESYLSSKIRTHATRQKAAEKSDGHMGRPQNQHFDLFSLGSLSTYNLKPRTRKRKELKKEQMDKFLIKGGKALRGTVAVSGAKNSALPVMAAALLTADRVVIRNVPKVRDLVTMSKLLAFMDAKV